MIPKRPPVPPYVLTQGERVMLCRRRAGLRRVDFAAMLGVRENAVARWESDQNQFVRGRVAPLEIDLPEWLWLQRTRARMSKRHVQHMTGLGTPFITSCERGDIFDVSALVMFWQHFHGRVADVMLGEG